MYAIVDVETTGGKFNEEGITEIAIYKFDGHEIVDQFASLINPEQPIQPFVVKLTGISNAMLSRAPKFYEIAKRVIQIMDGTTLVAHNANFDHRMLRLEFERLGYEFDMQTLCTVELAQKLMPEQESFSLGKLVRNLGIPITDRHRATGDALATVKLFKLLLNKDASKDIFQQSLKSFPKSNVAPNLKSFIDKMPSSTGMYYLYNESGELLQIGRSRNLKKTITQLFTSERKRSIELTSLVREVKFEKTGSELVAALKESFELQIRTPKFNRRPKKRLFSHGIYGSKTEDDYIRFHVKSTGRDTDYLTSFSNLKSARSFLESMRVKFELCRTFTDQKTESENDCGDDQQCRGACKNKESATDYNERAQQLIDEYSFAEKNLVIIDRGRETSERSIVWVQNGIIKGYGYADLQIQFTDPKILKNIITEIPENPNYRHLVQSHLRHKRVNRIIEI